MAPFCKPALVIGRKKKKKGRSTNKACKLDEFHTWILPGYCLRARITNVSDSTLMIAAVSASSVTDKSRC